MAERDWVPAGQGWEGKAAELRLVGWSRARRVVLLRRRLARDLAVQERAAGQLRLSFVEVAREGERQIYEFAALVTSLGAEILTLAQLYRDRADCENAFDELENHWGWGGFTTRDLERCRLIAGVVALVYNWWSLFVRRADPEHHREVITSRPLLLHAVAQQSRHGRQTRITVSSMHARAGAVARALRAIAAFFAGLKRTAEPLTALERWCRILSRALIKYLEGRVLKPPGHLLATPV